MDTRAELKPMDGALRYLLLCAGSACKLYKYLCVLLPVSLSDLGRRQPDTSRGACAQASSKMLKIAPATVAALAGAFYALTALSHHVQVEVFVI